MGDIAAMVSEENARFIVPPKSEAALAEALGAHRLAVLHFALLALAFGFVLLFTLGRVTARQIRRSS